MNFNIVLHQLEIPKFKIFNAYVEVIESLQWALRELGHSCSISRNTIDKEARNIVFGWEVAFQFFDLLHMDLRLSSMSSAKFLVNVVISTF